MPKLKLIAQLFLAIAALLASSSPARAADEPRVFAPSSEWKLSSDAESCWITRQFGSGDEGLRFQLQSFGPGESYKLLLYGKPLPDREGGVVEVQTRFNPDDRALANRGVLSSVGGKPQLVLRTALEMSSRTEARRSGTPMAAMIDVVREAAVDEFVVAFSRGRPLALQLGSMREPIGQLRQCSLGLLRNWGLDPVLQQTLTHLPTPIDIGQWLTPGKFPYDYYRNNRSAMVHYRLMVDEQGMPTSCVIQAPKAGTSAEIIACREIMKMAKFEPARDARGSPVASYFNSSVFFVMERRNGHW